MKFIKLITSEIFLVIFLSLLSLIAGMSPTIYRYLVTPPDRVFAGSEFYSDDYSVYVAAIKEGQHGSWLVHDKHTSENFQGTIMHSEYLFLGKIAGLFNLSPILGYHLARFFFGLIFLMVFYYFLRLVFPQNSLARKLSFFFYIVAGSFPIINSNPSLNSKWYLSWLMEAETVMRNVVLPHYLFGFIFFLLSAIFFIKTVSQKENSGRNYILAILFGNLLAFTHSAELIILYVSLVFLSILCNLRYLRFKNLDKLFYALPCFLKTIIFIIATSPFLFYAQHEFTKEPWSYAIKAWENQSGFYTTITGFKEYTLTLGPVFILGILGIYIFLKKKLSTLNSQLSTWLLFCLSWLLAHFSLVYLSYPLLKIAPLRFLHNPILIPISIFATLFVINLSINLTSLPRAALGNLPRAALGRIIIPVVCFIVLAISAPVYFYTLKYHFQTFNDFSTLIYPSKEMVKSFDWLSQNTNPNDAVLTAYEAGSLIPFMSGNTVYAGHLWSTINYQEKSQKAGDFFQGVLPTEIAYSFLRKGNIKLIYYGPQEQSAGGQIEKYDFLKEIYQNNEIRIYKIN